MNLSNQIKDREITTIVESLQQSAITIYRELKSGSGLDVLQTTNTSADEQIGLDVFADECFLNNINKQTTISYILSEERPDMVRHGLGKYSLTLDPLDGSKSAQVGIPCGAIFGLFEDVNTISDFNGSHIVMGGFFVFGINLEMYLAIDQKAYKGTWNSEKANWDFIQLPALPDGKMIAINASNKNKWASWLQNLYDDLVNNEDKDGKSYNMRWYASMVAEIKRLIIQGGIFIYPGDRREGYANGHLRLIYEAIPMAYLVHSLGGLSSNGDQSILDVKVSEAHQKTPVFLGNKDLIKRIESIRK